MTTLPAPVIIRRELTHPHAQNITMAKHESCLIIFSNIFQKSGILFYISLAFLNLSKKILQEELLYWDIDIDF